MQIKREYEDCLLFFRLGDFYELFLEDAKIGANVLGITLTARPRGKDGDIPMAGVPYHAAEGYIAKLVSAGYKVAICEQITQPNTKEIVHREVVRIVTPGTLIDESSLRPKEHNFFLVMAPGQHACGVVVVDIGTGDIRLAQLEGEDLLGNSLRSFLDTFHPVECIVSPDWYSDPTIIERIVKERSINLFPYDAWVSDKTNLQEIINTYINEGEYSQLRLDESPRVLEALGNALSYVTHTQKGTAPHIKKISWHSSADHMGLDSATINNLELFEHARDRSTKRSLVSLLDETMTAMGGRLLRQWVRAPLVSVVEIQERHDVVDILLKKPLLRKTVRKTLSQLYDLERLVSRVSLGYGGPKDLINISLTVGKIQELFSALPKSESATINRLVANSSPEASQLAVLIGKTISIDNSGSVDYSIASGSTESSTPFAHSFRRRRKPSLILSVAKRKKVDWAL
ncbi:MAG: DNA mismatch repair protein MutS [Microgenomates bacterium OLB22]|nr:MAG: DNA mismatch repair protein MutS [Microgenomates bacterium OLB22]